MIVLIVCPRNDSFQTIWVREDRTSSWNNTWLKLLSVYKKCCWDLRGTGSGRWKEKNRSLYKPHPIYLKLDSWRLFPGEPRFLITLLFSFCNEMSMTIPALMILNQPFLLWCVSAGFKCPSAIVLLLRAKGITDEFFIWSNRLLIKLLSRYSGAHLGYGLEK